MTPEEADAAYDAAPAIPISRDEIREIVKYATSSVHGMDGKPKHRVECVLRIGTHSIDELTSLIRDLCRQIDVEGLRNCIGGGYDLKIDENDLVTKESYFEQLEKFLEEKHSE